MKLKNCIPFCFVVAASLGGCGASEPGPAGPAGPSGPTGPEGQPGAVEPKLTALTPSSAFLSRTLELQISGTGTHYTSGTTVDFGDDQITTSQITVGSDANLRLTLQVGVGAKIGDHDVTVTSGSESVVLKSAFATKVALQAEPVAQRPMIPQGGLYPFSLRNLDYLAGPVSGGRATFSGFSLASSPSLTGARLEGVAIIDALTPPGLLSVSAVSKSPFGADVYYSTAPTDSSLAMAVARTPTTLTNDTPRTGESFTTPSASNFYKLTTSAASQVLVLTYSGLGTKLKDGMTNVVTALAPASGKFSQGSTASWSFDMTALTGLFIAELPTAGDYYLAAFPYDYRGAATGYTYTVTPKVATLTTMNNAEPASETPANPSLKINSLTGAIGATAGKLTTYTDTDYVIFTAATTGTVLLQLVNTTVPDGYFVPVSVQLYSDATCTTELGYSNQASPGDTLNQQIAVTAGTTYCAKFYIPFMASVDLSYKILLVP